MGNKILEKFVERINFTSQEDFEKNFRINVPENFNFGYDVMDAWAEVEPNKKAICWVNDKGEHVDFTYADLKKKTDETASFFLSLGIKKGDMVMLILKRRYEFWFSIIALHKIGAVVIPATHLLTEHDIVYRANAAKIKAIVCVGDERTLCNVQTAVQQSPSVDVLISIGPNVPAGFHDFNEGLKNAPAFVRPADGTKNDDISLLYFTSGTTGEPKMVIHDFLYPLGHIVTGSIWHHLHEKSLHLTVADTGWGKAVWGKLYGQFMAGATVFIYDHEKFTPADMLRMIQDYKITSFCAPPTVFRFMICENLSRFDLSSIKWCTIAGEALNPSVYEEFYKLTGIKLREGFGQTETTCSVLTTPWMNPKPGSMGRPNPLYNIDVVDGEGNSVPTGEQGEIVIRTDVENKPLGMFMGYYKDAALTKEVWSDGMYHTCDVAYRDEDGYLWFVGRNDDVIKSSGYRIGPFEVESAVMAHPGVVECAVVGEPDEIRGQVVKAFIVLNDEYKAKADDLLVKEIQNFVKTTTAPYKYPRIIEFVDSLPKTISGKIRRVEMRKK